MAQTDRILKVDGVGRVWTPREQREAVPDEFERSGLPATKFAAHIGVKYPTFASWVQKRRQRRGDGVACAGKAPAALKWVEATADDAKAGTAGTLMVHLTGGARLEVNVEELLNVLSFESGISAAAKK